MRIEFNGRKIVDAGHFVYCENCPLNKRFGPCLAQLFNITEDCRTGFKYEDSI